MHVGKADVAAKKRFIPVMPSKTFHLVEHCLKLVAGQVEWRNGTGGHWREADFMKADFVFQVIPDLVDAVTPWVSVTRPPTGREV